jgi:hypothetical protein
MSWASPRTFIHSVVSGPQNKASATEDFWCPRGLRGSLEKQSEDVVVYENRSRSNQLVLPAAAVPVPDPSLFTRAPDRESSSKHMHAGHTRYPYWHSHNVCYSSNARTNSQHPQMYDGPPINKARVLINLLWGPPGDPDGGGELHQHFEEIVGVLRAQFFRTEFMHVSLDTSWEVSLVGSLEIGVRARVRNGGG